MIFILSVRPNYIMVDSFIFQLDSSFDFFQLYAWGITSVVKISGCSLTRWNYFCMLYCRTKEQLGYVVQCGPRMTYRVLGFCFCIQSSNYNPYYLHQKIENFVGGLHDLLVSQRYVIRAMVLIKFYADFSVLYSGISSISW